MKLRSIIYAAAVPLIAGATLASTAGLASAATQPGAVHAVTHSAQHEDTTSGPGGGALKMGSNGPIWAYDNLTEQFTVTQTGDQEYKVVIDVTGSFKGFADPGRDGTTDPLLGYGQALTSSGPVKGTITYYVVSTSGPDPSKLLPNQAPETGLGAALQQLFPGFLGYDNAPADAGAYTFSYQNGNYVQDTTGIHGDVTGH